MSSQREFAAEVFTGTISNLRCRQRKQDFILNEARHTYIDATATAAAISGMSAQAIGLLQMSANSAEEADWVGFDVDGTQFEGWLWKMPMSDGDVVEVVAEPKQDGRYFAYSVRRVDDGVIAVYPHVTSGKSALYRRIMKYMLIAALICNGVVTAMMFNAHEGTDPITYFSIMGPAWTLSFLVFWILFHRAYLKMRSFAVMAEILFSCYGWRDVSKIDLIRASKGVMPKNAKPDEFGIYYFRYCPGPAG